MLQERLSGLAMLSIENDLLDKLEYNDFINKFAFQKTRKINFKMNQSLLFFSQ